VALDHPALDRIVVRSILHEVPCAIGDDARIDRRGIATEQLCIWDAGSPGASFGRGSSVASRHIPVAITSRF